LEVINIVIFICWSAKIKDKFAVESCEPTRTDDDIPRLMERLETITNKGMLL